MNVKEYYTTELHDYQISPKLLKHSRDANIPIAVVGNGGSLSELTSEQIDILNTCRMFRCNWAFDDPSKLKKQYALYFAQAFNGSGEKDFTSTVTSASHEGRFEWYKFQKTIVYDYSPFSSVLNSEGMPVWPTTGIQMLLTAAFLIPCPEIHIAGLDMYTYKREKSVMSKKESLEYLKKHGKQFGRSPTGSIGIGLGKENLTYVHPKTWVEKIQKIKATYHYVELDILLLFKIFSHCMYHKRPVHIYNSDTLSGIYDITKDNKDIIHGYFLQDKNKFNSYEAIYKVYNMWRLINKTMDQVLPD